MRWTPAVVLAAAGSGVAAATAMGAIVASPPRLARRLRPHLAAALGRAGLTVPAPPRTSAAELLRAGRDRLTALGGVPAEAGLGLALRRSGLWPHLSDGERRRRYRTTVAGAAATTAAAGIVATSYLGASAGGAFLAGALGAVGGASLAHSRVERARRARCERLRLELATVTQLLAARIRSGGGVVSSVADFVARAGGEVAGELADALRLHQGGVAAGDAFARIATMTPEYHARRCYLALAAAERRGADVAAALQALADDVRSDRRERMREAATRRRAAMLVPIVGMLAPILLLFVAAPLPWIVVRSL